MKFLLIIFLVCFSLNAFSQADTSLPLFKRFPTVPPINLILPDSTTHYTKEDLPKNTPVLIIFFSPECEHCQQEAQDLAAHKKDFNKIHVVMVSTYPFYRMEEFKTKYKLTALRSLVMAKDPTYFLITFFNMHNFPFIALYNKKGDLITTHEGTQPVPKILEQFKDSK